MRIFIQRVLGAFLTVAVTLLCIGHSPSLAPARIHMMATPTFMQLLLLLFWSASLALADQRGPGTCEFMRPQTRADSAF